VNAPVNAKTAQPAQPEETVSAAPRAHTAPTAPTAPRTVKEVSVKLLVRDDGWIFCSPEVAGFVMQVADSLLNQRLYEAQLEAHAKPKVILATS
jgi:hypothetical protein